MPPRRRPRRARCGPGTDRAGWTATADARAATAGTPDDRRARGTGATRPDGRASRARRGRSGRRPRRARGRAGRAWRGDGGSHRHRRPGSRPPGAPTRYYQATLPGNAGPAWTNRPVQASGRQAEVPLPGKKRWAILPRPARPPETRVSALPLQPTIMRRVSPQRRRDRRGVTREHGGRSAPHPEASSLYKGMNRIDMRLFCPCFRPFCP